MRAELSNYWRTTGTIESHMDAKYTIELTEGELTYLMDFLMDQYTEDRDARDLARLISSKTHEYTEQIEELDHDFKDETTK